MTTAHLIEDLKRDEGCRLHAYVDSVGVITIGYGHAHVAPGTIWTQAQADAWLKRDIKRAAGLLDANIPWWRELNDARQDVLVNMAFNLGWGDGKHGLSSFHNTLAAIRAGDYERAADGMLASKWATQVHARANRLAKQMRSGVRLDHTK